MKTPLLLLVILVLTGTTLFAQVPQAVPYQAVARNAAGNLVANQSISIRLSLHNSTAAGPVVYQESHTVNTNQFGLFTVNLGQGNVLSGSFPGINWGVDAKYLQVEFDPAGGASFINMGTSQLLSVPYALFAGSGANLPNGTAAGNTLRWDGTSWIADNAIYSDGLKVGLGTTIPGVGPNFSAKLDIRDEDGNNSDISQTVAGGGGFPALLWTKTRGTLALPTTVTNGTFLGGIQGNYYNGTNYRIGAAMYYLADTVVDNWHPASIQFRTTGYGNANNFTRMVIKHNGNVGINTTLPQAKLDVRGTVSIKDGTEALGKIFTSDANGLGSWQPAPLGNVPNGTLLGNTLRWDGTSWLADNALYSDGSKIGLGTTTPGIGANFSAKLDIHDEDGNNSDIGQTVAGAGFPAILWTKHRGTLAAPTAVTSGTFLGSIQGNYFNGTSNRIGASLYYVADTAVDNWHPASIYFRTTGYGNVNNLTRMVIKHNGNVGIGTTLPQAKLDVRGTVSIKDGSEAAGKIFTSDANGLGSWQPLPPGNVPNGTLMGNTLRWSGSSWLADNALFNDGLAIGLGTATPGLNGFNPYVRLDIRDETGGNSDIQQLVAGGGIPTISWAQQRGTLAAPLPITAGSVFGRLDGNYYTASGYSQGNNRAASIFFAADTLVDSGNPGSIYFATTRYGQTAPNTNLVIKHNGKIGIGTNNPQARLDVNGNIKIADGTQGIGKVLTSDANGTASWQVLPPVTPSGAQQIAFFAGNENVPAQAIPAATPTKISFGNGFASFNDGGGYNTATSEFTPPVPGVYQINATVNFQGVPGEVVNIDLRFSAAHILKTMQVVPAGGTGTATISCTYNSTVTLGPIWLEAYATFPLTVLKLESGFSGHLLYAYPLKK